MNDAPDDVDEPGRDEPDAEDAALSPAEMLRLAEWQRQETSRRLDFADWPIYLAWGVAWIIAYGLFFLRYGAGGGAGPVPMPDAVPMIALIVLNAAAIAVTGVVVYRGTRDLEGPANRAGFFYGVAWAVGFVFVFAILGRLAAGIPEQLIGMAYGGAGVGLVGLLYVAGAAVWGDRRMFLLGLWVTGANLAGIWFLPEWHTLIICVFGGVGLVVGAAIAFRGRSSTTAGSA